MGAPLALCREQWEPAKEPDCGRSHGSFWTEQGRLEPRSLDCHPVLFLLYILSPLCIPLKSSLTKPEVICARKGSEAHKELELPVAG